MYMIIIIYEGVVYEYVMDTTMPPKIFKRALMNISFINTSIVHDNKSVVYNVPNPWIRNRIFSQENFLIYTHLNCNNEPMTYKIIVVSISSTSF